MASQTSSDDRSGSVARNTPAWLKIFRPIECLQGPLFRGSKTQSWHATVEFKRWVPPKGGTPLAWKETYGKTQIIGRGGARTVAEVELVDRLRAAGWKAGWLDTFGHAPAAWRGRVVKQADLPTALGRWLNRITVAAGSKRGGRPDVVAWRGPKLADAVFAEYKGPNDRIRNGQDAWCCAAAAKGLRVDQFAVVRWPRQRSRRVAE